MTNPSVGNLTRRTFLELAARQSVAAAAAANALLAACRPTAHQPSALGLDRRALDTFVALIDEIIPASDGMPAASAAGTLAYLELLAASEAALADTARAAVAAADGLGRERTGKPFASIEVTERAVVVTALAEREKVLFKRLRDYVYEGYYLQPQVWARLGYEPYPTGGAGPTMARFDPAMLDRVRAMPRRYRSA